MVKESWTRPLRRNEENEGNCYIHKGYRFFHRSGKMYFVCINFNVFFNVNGKSKTRSECVEPAEMPTELNRSHKCDRESGRDFSGFRVAYEKGERAHDFNQKRYEDSQHMQGVGKEDAHPQADVGA